MSSYQSRLYSEQQQQFGLTSSYLAAAELTQDTSAVTTIKGLILLISRRISTECSQCVLLEGQLKECQEMLRRETRLRRWQRKNIKRIQELQSELAELKARVNIFFSLLSNISETNEQFNWTPKKK